MAMTFENQMSKQQHLENAIAAIKILKSSPKALSVSERAILMGFCGGGVLKECGIFLEKDKPEWLKQGKMQLLELLSKQEWTSLQNAGLQNAHYTSPGVRRVMWDVLTPLLKPGDKVLDPGCGVAGFAVEMPSFFKYVGVEKDGLSAAIAKLAHPTLQIYHKDFLKWSYPEQFNLVIGNVLFVNGVESMKLEGKWLRIGLHAQFFATAVSHLLPSGLLALLTSTNTLDSRTPDYLWFREWMHKKCEFLGAVRLPSGSHIGETEVTTDLILLRRRESDCTGLALHWIGVGQTDIVGYDGRPAYLSNWYLENPNYLIGEPVCSKLRGKNGNPTTTFALKAYPNQDVPGVLKTLLSSLVNQQVEASIMSATLIPADKFHSNSVFAFILRENPKKRGIEIHLPTDCDTSSQKAVSFIAKILGAGFQKSNSNPKMYYAPFSEELMQRARGWVESCKTTFKAYELSPEEPVESTPTRRRYSKKEPAATITPTPNKLLEAIAQLIDAKLDPLAESIGTSIIEQLKSEHKNSLADAKALKDELEKVKAERDGLAKSLEQIRSEMLDFQKSYTDLEKKSVQQQESIKYLEQERERQRETIEALQHDDTQQQQTIQVLQQRCARLHNQLQELGLDDEDGEIESPIFLDESNEEKLPVFADESQENQESPVFSDESDETSNTPSFEEEKEAGFDLTKLDSGK
jgi:hypothetical protein